MDNTDKKLLALLRANGRMHTTRLAAKAKIPVSTAHDRLKKLSRYVARYTSLIDIAATGTAMHTWLCVAQTKESVKRARENRYINNTILTTQGLMIECCFPNEKEYLAFTDGLQVKQLLLVGKEIKREGAAGDAER